MTTYIPSLTLPSAIFENAAASILLPVLAGTAVGFSTRPSQTQNTYLAIRQPPLRPPPWVFGPAWTLLYACMGYAAHRAWTSGAHSPIESVAQNTRHGATLYTLQLGLNLIWMPLFFGFKKPIPAMVDILALGGTISYMTYLWGQVDETAGWLLAPYLGWVGFATYLCGGAGYLNDWNFSGKDLTKSA